MGLDMYLYKKNFIWSGDWVKPEHKQEVLVKKGGELDTKIKPERVKYVVEEIGYWRKANHIHNWFVENVQNGIDECQESWVSREHLETLLAKCKEVLENRGTAESSLPTQSGFFFGSTDYDEYYFGDIERTVEIIEEALSDETADDFTYRASW